MENLSPKESVKGADAVLRGSGRAPEEFSESKHKATKPTGPSQRLAHSAPRTFNSC